MSEPSVAIVVPWRAGDSDRERAWQYAEHIWQKFDWPIYQVEHPGPTPFNRSWCINEGARRAEDFDVIVAIDADVFPQDLDQVRTGVSHALETGRLTVPHTIGADLTRLGTDKIVRGESDWSQFTNAVRDPCTSRITIVRADLFAQVGGFDTRFQGWGHEDIAFWAAAVCLRGVDQLPGTAWHLWHTPSLNAAKRTREWAAGKRLADRYVTAFLNGWVAMERLLNERSPSQKFVPGQPSVRDQPPSPGVDVICLAAGRRVYLDKTLQSFETNVTGNIARKTILDDSRDPNFSSWLKRRWGRKWEIVTTPGLLGFTEAIRFAWEHERGREGGSDYIFHLEEDFTFNHPVDLRDMIEVLDGDSKLAQVALLRGAFFPPEIRAGGIIQQDPSAYKQEHNNGFNYLTHTKYFTTNPCIYRRSLLDIGWPAQKDSETVFTKMLARKGYRFALMGSGEPWVTHIGAQRTGRGY